MSKRQEMKDKIPRETLKQLLLEDKTSTEIGKMYGFTGMDIDRLKALYGLSKAALQEEKEAAGNQVQDQTKTAEEPKPPAQETTPEAAPPAPEKQGGKPPVQVTAEQFTAWFESIIPNNIAKTDDGKLVINIQNIVINVGVCS